MSKEIEEYRFDCNGRCAPAYTCSKPGDNSGAYFKAEDVRTLLSMRDEGKTTHQPFGYLVIDSYWNSEDFVRQLPESIDSSRETIIPLYTGAALVGREG